MLTNEEQSFLDQMFRQYGPRLRGHCLRLTASPDQADESVQMTFLAATERVASLMVHPNPAGWLYVTALHMVRRLRRTAMRAAGQVSTDGLESDLSLSTSAGEDRMDTGIDVRAALEQLDGKDRKLYQMIFEQDMDYARIAEEEQTTEAAVKMRAMRMRRKVKKLLEE